MTATIFLTTALALAALMPEQAQAWPSDKQLRNRCPVNFMIVMKPSRKRDWCQYWSGRMP